jgi:hypothetical protein
MKMAIWAWRIYAIVVLLAAAFVFGVGMYTIVSWL